MTTIIQSSKPIHALKSGQTAYVDNRRFVVGDQHLIEAHPQASTEPWRAAPSVSVDDIVQFDGDPTRYRVVRGTGGTFKLRILL